MHRAVHVLFLAQNMTRINCTLKHFYSIHVRMKGTYTERDVMYTQRYFP
jgi:hypothetical protein